MVGSTTSHKLEVCGSYRRGIETCGDVDIIVTRVDGGNSEKKVILDLVTKLEQLGFLTEHLTYPKTDNSTSLSYMGICVYEGTRHRIDIKFYPDEQFPFAILYFTGSR